VRFGAGLLIGVSLASCGLISSDVTNFDLSLPDKKFTIDIGGWKVDQTATDSYLTRSCTMSQTCNTAVQSVCPMGCSGTCNMASPPTCDLSLDVSLSQPVNLVMEQPALQSINDEPVIKVTVDSVTYVVTGNSLNVDTPEITIYVAPMSVAKIASDPQIKAIGTIPPVPAGQTTGAQPIKFTATGKADLVTMMSTFKTPFNVLAGASIVVSDGQAVPAGRLDTVVRIKGHAGV
jgi:hypothetical protein